MNCDSVGKENLCFDAKPALSLLGNNFVESLTISVLPPPKRWGPEPILDPDPKVDLRWHERPWQRNDII